MKSRENPIWKTYLINQFIHRVEMIWLEEVAYVGAIGIKSGNQTDI